MKTLKIIAITAGLLTLAQLVYFIAHSSNKASIGIIGSADGPTVIYYAPPNVQDLIWAISAIVTITATILLLLKK